MGLNLHAIVRGAITAVNPDTVATWRRSRGYETDARGKRVPVFDDFPGTRIQVQPPSGKDLQHLDALNIEGITRSVHTYGNPDGVDRKQAAGGDLFVWCGDTWKVVTVMETWPGWGRCMVQKQTDAEATP